MGDTSANTKTTGCPPYDERARVLDLLRRHGRDAVSFQVLEPGLRYWFSGEEACVAYAEVAGGRAWVAAGGPIAEPADEVAVMERFVAEARSHGRRACFFGIERDVSPEGGLDVIHVGEQPIWDPRRWTATLKERRSLREQLRRARAKGVVVRVVEPGEIDDPGGGLRRQIDALIGSWLAARSMAPMQFVVSLRPYEFPAERRFLVAECDGRLVGILVAVPIYARGGYLLEDVLRDPAAPNGTVELMFDAVMRILAAEGCEHATFGMVPLGGVRSRLLRAARRAGRPLYDFEGLLRFKRKLAPQRTHHCFVAYPRGGSRLLALLDVLRAFAAGSLLRFGWRTLVHRAREVVLALSVLLVPWTAFLAAVPTKPWFPSREVQVMWVGFDAVICAFCLVVHRIWNRALLAILSALFLLDCLLGAAQAVLWNVPNSDGIVDALIVPLAVVAPFAAALLVWRARIVAGAGRSPP